MKTRGVFFTIDICFKEDSQDGEGETVGQIEEKVKELIKERLFPTIEQHFEGPELMSVRLWK